MNNAFYKDELQIVTGPVIIGYSISLLSFKIKEKEKLEKVTLHDSSFQILIKRRKKHLA